MPDMQAFMKRPRHRRSGDAPRMEAQLWVLVMSRRIEASVSRDWNFGFASHSYLFNSAMDLSRTLYAYESNNPQGEDTKITAASLEAGAVQIAKAMWGKYTDPKGVGRNVNGDMTKVRWVPGLNPAAHKLLHHIEHACRNLPEPKKCDA